MKVGDIVIFFRPDREKINQRVPQYNELRHACRVLDIGSTSLGRYIRFERIEWPGCESPPMPFSKGSMRLLSPGMQSENFQKYQVVEGT